MKKIKVAEENKKIMQNIIDTLDGVEGATMHNAESIKIDENEQNIEFMKNMLVELNKTEQLPTSGIIRERIKDAGANYYANSNISEFIEAGEKEELIDEATNAFTSVLDTLIIDHKNDPNSMDTPHRLAKMYINELMEGRYVPMPKMTAFPNKHTGKDTGFNGLLVVKVELTSLCAHHFAVVDGICYIGIIPGDNVIGLSKYTRLAQWLARRGTLQEELTEEIVDAIIAISGAESVACLTKLQHGCCSDRGIKAHDSTTQATVLKGSFLTDGVLRKEFHDNVMFQEMHKK